MLKFGSYSTPPPSPVSMFSLSQTSCISPVELTDGRKRSAIIRTRKSLVLYKPFSTLWWIWSLKSSPSICLTKSHTWHVGYLGEHRKNFLQIGECSLGGESLVFGRRHIEGPDVISWRGLQPLAGWRHFCILCLESEKQIKGEKREVIFKAWDIKDGVQVVIQKRKVRY